MPNNQAVFSRASADRKPEFQLLTIIKDGPNGLSVSKRTARPEALGHLQSFSAKFDDLSHQSLAISPAKIISSKDNEIQFEYIHGQSFQSMFETAINNGDFKEVMNVFASVMKLIDSFPKSRLKPNTSNDFLTIFGSNYSADYDCVSPACIDLNLDNLFLEKSGKVRLIDYEWVFKFPVPVEFIKLRVIQSAFAEMLPSIMRVFPHIEMIAYGDDYVIPKDITKFVTISSTTVGRYLDANKGFLNYVQNYQSSPTPLKKRVIRQAIELREILSGGAVGQSAPHLQQQLHSQNEHISKQDHVIREQIKDIQALQEKLHSLTNTLSHKTAVRAELKVRSAVRKLK